MEVQAPLGRYRYRLEEAIEQPALATADRAVQIEAARLASVQQTRNLRGHAVDDPALTIAELIAAAGGLVFEPAEQFALLRSGSAQALAELAQRCRDPGGQGEASLGKCGAARSLPEASGFDQYKSARHLSPGTMGSGLALQLAFYHVLQGQPALLQMSQVFVDEIAGRDRFGSQYLVVDIHILVEQTVQGLVLLAPLLDDLAG